MPRHKRVLPGFLRRAVHKIDVGFIPVLESRKVVFRGEGWVGFGVALHLGDLVERLPTRTELRIVERQGVSVRCYIGNVIPFERFAL